MRIIAIANIAIGLLLTVVLVAIGQNLLAVAGAAIVALGFTLLRQRKIVYHNLAEASRQRTIVVANANAVPAAAKMQRQLDELAIGSI